MASNGYTPPPQGLLAERFPVNSLQELTLQTGEAVSGRVYCTDEMTGSIVLQKALAHTTLASEIRIVAAASVAKSIALEETGDDGAAAATPLTQPLPKIQKKALEERERRAIRMAEESLRHINQKVRPIILFSLFRTVQHSDAAHPLSIFVPIENAGVACRSGNL